MGDRLSLLTEVLTLIATLVSVSSVIFYTFSKFHKREVQPLKDDIAFIKDNFVPNGGSSLKDALNRIEDKLSSLYASTGLLYEFNELPCVTTDSVGMLDWANKAYLTLTAATIDEVRGNGWVNQISIPDRDRVKAEWASCVRERREYVDEFTMSNGVQVRAHAVPVYSSRNEIIKWVAVLIVKK